MILAVGIAADYGNFIYVKALLRTLDVLSLSEHWLYEDELSFLDSLDNNFDVISCSSSQNSVLERWKRGQGGIALFLKKNLKAKEIQISCDRIVSASFTIGTIKTVVRCTVEQLNRYQEHLNSFLSSVVREGDLPDVNDFYEELINSIKKADQILPRVKYKSYIKPFWNEELKVLRKSVMAARAEWKQAGSPRQRSSILYMKYKKLKCEYRREQRRAIWEFQRKEFNEIGNTQDLDNEKFWRLINNKARGKNKKGKDMSLEVDGEFITDPKQMADLWANYF